MVQCEETFLKLLEFLYCDQFVKPLTCEEVRKVAAICEALKLSRTHCIL